MKAAIPATINPFSQSTGPLPNNVLFELEEAKHRVKVVGRLMWEKILRAEERAELGADFDQALMQFGGTLKMYLQARPKWHWRAVIEIARGTDLLSESDYRWLDREISKVDPLLSNLRRSANRPDLGERDVDEIIEVKRNHHRLLLVRGNGVERLYWEGVRMAVNWRNIPKIWEFLWQLGERAKTGQPVTWDALGCESHRTLINRRARLKKFIPAALDALIESAKESYRLKVAPSEIFTLELSGDEWLLERTG